MTTPHASSQSNSAARELAEKIETRTACIGVVGLGYVGLPLAHALHSAGHSVLGFDVDPNKVEALLQGQSYLKHLGSDMTRELHKSDRFEPTVDFARFKEADAIVVCVPTPLGPHHEPDLSYVLTTAQAIGAELRAGQLLILESTTYPGTTRDEFLPAILSVAKEKGVDLECGRDFFVAYSPEREDPGSKSHNTSTIPKLVGGLDDEATALAADLYRSCITEVYPVRNAEVAEASKLLENIFRAVNIALVNEMKILLEEMGINVWEVVEAASTKPFGFMPFYPGPGLGGHCIPIDPFYLSWKAREVGKPTRFIELAGEINTEMPSYVVNRVVMALNDAGKAIRNSRILVLGLAYKADVDDTRESPSFELIAKLSAMGAKVEYSDPHIAQTVPVRRHDLQMTSIELTPESIASYDAILVATAHSLFDYKMLADHARLIVDTRQALKGFEDRLGPRLVRA